MRVGVAKVIEDERTRSRDERRDVDVREDTRGEPNSFWAIWYSGIYTKESQRRGSQNGRRKWDRRTEEPKKGTKG